MKLLDLFSGIGGFHKGFEEAGFKFDWVGFSEIDKYATAVYKYRFPNAKELGDIAAIRPERDLPDNIDLLCGGFPCQAFSVAGRRKGFEDTRGTLFFEIARILRHFRDTKKPIPYFVLENVKGLLSHDDGRTFAIIYRVLTDIGYTVECQLLNTRWVLPQNRERIYIVGHFGTGSGCKVFPIGESAQLYNKKSTQDYRQISNCIDSNYHKGWLDHGQRTMINTGLKQIGVVGKDTIATRIYDPSGISSTLTDGGGMGAKTGLYKVNKLIRRLTPIECMRLQGFPDDWNEKGMIDGKEVNMSDTQRYKQAGNAVSVPIVSMVAERIKDGQ